MAFTSHWFSRKFEEAPYNYAQGVGIGTVAVDLSLSTTLGGLSLSATINVALPVQLSLNSNLGALTLASQIIQGVLLQQAVYDLVNAGLEPIVLYSQSDVVPYGYVVSWNPPVGTVLAPWSTVTVTASTGPFVTAPSESPIPNVVGLATWDASTALFDAGFSLDEYTWSDSNTTQGTVLSQSPIAGTLALPGTIVALTVSKGPAPATETTVVPS